MAAAATDGAYTLFMADFSDTDVAWQAYEALKEAEDGRTLEVEGVLGRQARGGREARDPEVHRPQHPQGPDVGSRGWRGARASSSRRRSSAVPPRWAPSEPPQARPAQLHHRGQLSDQLESAIEPGHLGSWRSCPTPARWRSGGRSRLRTRSSRRPSTTSWPATSRRQRTKPRRRKADASRTSSAAGCPHRVLSASEGPWSTKAPGPGNTSASWPVSDQRTR